MFHWLISTLNCEAFCGFYGGVGGACCVGWRLSLIKYFGGQEETKTQRDHLNLKNTSFKGTNCNNCNSLSFLFLIFTHSQSSKYICHLDAADFFYMNKIRRHSPCCCICPLLQTHRQLGSNAGEITNKRYFRDVSLFSFHLFFIRPPPYVLVCTPCV